MLRVSFQSSSLALPVWDGDGGWFEAIKVGLAISEEAFVKALAADASDS
jgi:hypothetical protein